MRGREGRGGEGKGEGEVRKRDGEEKSVPVRV